MPSGRPAGRGVLDKAGVVPRHGVRLIELQSLSTGAEDGATGAAEGRVERVGWGGEDGGGAYFEVVGFVLVPVEVAAAEGYVVGQGCGIGIEVVAACGEVRGAGRVNDGKVTCRHSCFRQILDSHVRSASLESCQFCIGRASDKGKGKCHTAFHYVRFSFGLLPLLPLSGFPHAAIHAKVVLS